MKRLLSFTLCLILLVSLLSAPGTALEAPASDGDGLPVSGVWGALSWEISADGVLTVSGAGQMEPFGGDVNRPWHTYTGQITKAVFGEGITGIAPYALTVCGKLQEIRLPSTLRTLGDGAFYGNAALEAITLPDGLEEIGSDAFGSCAGLKSVTIPASVKKLGALAFYHCSALERAALGNGLTKLEEEVFSGCTSLESVAFGEGILSIGQNAFHETGLTDLVLPDCLESIDNGAFSNCSGLEGVTIPTGIKSIGSMAFANDDRLKTVRYEGSEGDWYSIDISGGNDPLWNAIGYSLRHAGTLPSGVSWALEGSTLTISGEGAINDDPWFPYASSVKTIIIEEGVTEIGDSSFNNCENVETIYIPLSVKRIGFWAVHTADAVEYPGTQEQWEQIEIGEGNAYSIEFRGIDPNYSGDERYSTRVTVTMQTPSRAMQEGVSLYREGYDVNHAVEYELEVELSIDGGATWFSATERNLPEKGVVIKLPYPYGTSPEKQDFIAVWVNSSNGWSGATPTKEQDGLVLTINRLDNIVVAWKDTDGEEEQPTPWKEFDENTFTDVDLGAWYYDYVGFVYQSELMVGMTDTTFVPGGQGSRAQVVTILYRLADEPEVSGPIGFSDVPEGKWYSDAVSWAAENGITSGYEDGTFRPNRVVTRQEFVTFMLRFSEYIGIAFKDDRWEDSYLEGFPDAGDVSSWARPAENWSVAVGFQSGSADTEGNLRLNPRKGVTRAELASFLARYCVSLEEILEMDLAHSLHDAGADTSGDVS